VIRTLTLAVVALTFASSLAAAPSNNAQPQAAEIQPPENRDFETQVRLYRSQGSQGLAELLARYDRLQRELEATPARPESAAQRTRLTAQLERLARLIDRVGGQRYCTSSRLFWHTDLAAAKAEAERLGRPILSLRMLGNLTDDLSCANSRFFRTTLYANKEIAKHLRENYVLHWKSVRPVPKITIDFGDGRKIVRTLTGNSIHYALDSRGRTLDGLPGLYGPQAFKEWIERMRAMSVVASHLNDSRYAEFLASYHGTAERRVLAAWQADLARIGARPAVNAPQPKRPNGPNPPTAARAARVAMTKARVETRLITEVTGRSVFDAEKTAKTMTEEQWRRIAALHAAKAKLDDASRELIRCEQPTAAAASAISITKRLAEDPLLRLVRNLENSVAIDTVRNEYLLHRQIHQWFARRQTPGNLEQLNERVYAQLFLTPSSDPWLGLVEPGVYTALPRGGVVADRGARSR